MNWGQVIGVISAALVLVGTWVTARFSARTASQANRTADWDKFAQRIETDNERLRSRLDVVETVLEEVRQALRERDRRIDELSSELEDFREYTGELRDELLRQDPALSLPVPPPRIARHFPPPVR